MSPVSPHSTVSTCRRLAGVRLSRTFTRMLPAHVRHPPGSTRPRAATRLPPRASVRGPRASSVSASALTEKIQLHVTASSLILPLNYSLSKNPSRRKVSPLTEIVSAMVSKERKKVARSQNTHTLFKNNKANR